ncbi:MAG: glycosyltransferase [Desulfovibrio desulfuricans]|nr:glycosyltransferase [Desulfovibrio desulfuricans]
MHILLIADANSIWTKKFIENILLHRNYKLSIITWSNKKFLDFYKKNKISVMQLNRKAKEDIIIGSNFRQTNRATLHDRIIDIFLKIIRSICPKYLRKYFRKEILSYRIMKFCKPISQYDIIHFLYIDEETEDIYDALPKDIREIFITYLGSDILRCNNEKCNLPLIERSKIITFMSKKLFDRFHEIYGTLYDNKIYVLDFGVSAYDSINNIRKLSASHVENRLLYSIPENKTCIMIGYNASPYQQHIKVLNAIKNIPEDMQSKIHVVVHFSYQRINIQYINDVCSSLKNSKFSSCVINRFLDDNEIARLRDAVDIFIHAQLTDALSASMLEYLFAGKIVLNGAWLKYKELEELGIRYFSFNDFNELSNILQDIILHYNKYKLQLTDNTSLLYGLNSWEAVRPHWLKLYETAMR